MVFDLLITFFLFAITVVMLAGTGSLLQQWLGLPEAWGSVLATIATVLIVCLDVRQVIAFIGAVTPLLVFLTVVVAAYVVSTRTPATTCCWSPRNSNRAAPASGWWPPSCTCPTTSSPACRSGHHGRPGQLAPQRAVGRRPGRRAARHPMLLIGAAMYLRIDTPGRRVHAHAGAGHPDLAGTGPPDVAGHLRHDPEHRRRHAAYAFVARILPAGGTPFRLGTTVAGIAALAGSFVGFIKLVGVVYPIYGYIGFLLMGCTLGAGAALGAAARHRIRQAGASSA